jgi:outer membrane protein assembly factor BamD (BamD/ComL family)
MKITGVQIWHLFLTACVFAAIGWVMLQILRKSNDPGALLVRWLATAIVAGAVIVVAVKANDPILKIAAILFGACCGIVFAVLWGGPFVEMVAKPFTNLYDGGDDEAEARPLYSMAEARRKQGKYEVAMAEIRSQLERFPDDFTGWMMIAEIQAENLNDVASANAVIERILAQDGHAPKNIAYALNRTADWALKFQHDPEAARAALERIIKTLPDTEQAQLAMQRIAHLTDADTLLDRKDPPRIALKKSDENIGLRRDFSDLRPVDEDPAQAAARYVKHLDAHPQDYEAREKLAVIYAEHYRHIDLACDQLEQLIAIPNQPPKQVVHWLNMIADLQIKIEGNVEAARKALQRIVEKFPKSAAAENATQRMAYIKLELKPHEKSQAIKLGSYDQNLGLKGSKTSS